MISIHALREEGDVVAIRSDSGILNFYPRPPRGGRHDAPLLLQYGVGISIHALREEGDSQKAMATAYCQNDFYPRPPRGGRLYIGLEIKRPFLDFYPRPPRGGRRCACAHGIVHGLFLSTPSARRATRHSDRAGPSRKISIHALREEGDLSERGFQIYDWEFLSTPSARRATKGKARKH